MQNYCFFTYQQFLLALDLRYIEGFEKQVLKEDELWRWRREKFIRAGSSKPTMQTH